VAERKLRQIGDSCLRRREGGTAEALVAPSLDDPIDGAFRPLSCDVLTPLQTKTTVSIASFHVFQGRIETFNLNIKTATYYVLSVSFTLSS
jgi:hypothetical protein